MKKIISILLTIIMVLCITASIPLSASATTTEDDEIDNGVYYDQYGTWIYQFTDSDNSYKIISYADIIGVHPFGNTLCVAKVSGQEIADVLEIGAVAAVKEVSENGLAAGENGSFMNVSGLKYTIDTSIEAGVEFDENGLVTNISDKRRVKDIMILNKDGEYEPIDMEKEYTLASHNYLLKENGSGATFFDDNEFVIEEGMADYQILITYLSEHISGSISENYSSVEGRIVVE